MRKELDEKLCKGFPNLYKDRNASIMSSCMPWGLDCNDGWYDLIYDLSSKLEPLIVKYKERNPPRKIKFLKFKQFYNDTLFAIIRFFAFRSKFKFSFSWMWSLGFDVSQPSYPCASQVKEKYGLLSFSMSSATDEMYRLTDEAEDKSGEICENCGKPGKTNKYGWISTLCDECRGFNLEEREKEFEKENPEEVINEIS